MMASSSSNIENNQHHPIFEEFGLLVSVFCLDGESCDIKTTFPNHVISVTQRVVSDDLDHDCCCLDNNDHDLAVNKNESTTTVYVSFDLPPDYPLVCPSHISIRCSHSGFTRNSASKISDLLKNEALALIGEPMLLQLCQSAKSHISEILAKNIAPKSGITVQNEKKQDVLKEENLLSIVEIDHMRNKIGYVKIISKWSNQLSLTLLVLQLLFKKRKQFLILMWGSFDNFKIFLKNLKTYAVDVDSAGKPCKEKLSRVLCSSLSGVRIPDSLIFNGVTFEEIESEPQLKTLLNRYNLSQVYDIVDC